MTAWQHTPPGWPGVPPAHTPGWEDRAVLWLLDQCPPDYRSYTGWRKHPIALTLLAGRHLEGQVVAMRDAWREARWPSARVQAAALDEILGQIEAEGIPPARRIAFSSAAARGPPGQGLRTSPLSGSPSKCGRAPTEETCARSSAAYGMARGGSCQAGEEIVQARPRLSGPGRSRVDSIDPSQREDLPA